MRLVFLHFLLFEKSVIILYLNLEQIVESEVVRKILLFVQEFQKQRISIERPSQDLLLIYS